MEPRLTKRTRGAKAYFTITWSDVCSLDKHTVRTSVPGQAGIFEVYHKPTDGVPMLLGRGSAYYGGIRGKLRALIDSVSPTGLHGRLLPTDGALYARYSLTESADDMMDVLFFFATQPVPFRDEEAEHSGRYDFVYVKEQPEDVALPT